MHDEGLQERARWRAVAAVILIASAGIAASGPAGATPSCTATRCTVFFTGTGGFGISQSDALFLGSELGIPLFPVSSVDELNEMLSVSDIDFDQEDDLIPFPPTTTGPSFADTEWTVQNVSADPLIGDLFFVFASVVNQFEFEGETISYGDDEVALIIPDDRSWEILLTTSGFYYPAVRIASLPTNGLSDAFPVRFHIDGGLETTAPNRYVLPQLLVGSAFTPIPEPSSALLLALGLAAIAARRSRHS
jgi:hypothetical protein